MRLICKLSILVDGGFPLFYLYIVDRFLNFFFWFSEGQFQIFYNMLNSTKLSYLYWFLFFSYTCLFVDGLFNSVLIYFFFCERQVVTCLKILSSMFLLFKFWLNWIFTLVRVNDIFLSRIQLGE